MGLVGRALWSWEGSAGFGAEAWLSCCLISVAFLTACTFTCSWKTQSSLLTWRSYTGQSVLVRAWSLGRTVKLPFLDSVRQMICQWQGNQVEDSIWIQWMPIVTNALPTSSSNYTCWYASSSERSAALRLVSFAASCSARLFTKLRSSSSNGLFFPEDKIESLVPGRHGSSQRQAHKAKFGNRE